VLTVGVAAATAGCSSGESGKPHLGSASASSTPTATPVLSGTNTPAPVSGAPTSVPSSAGVPTAQHLADCAPDSLKLNVLSLSGASQQKFVRLTITNSGSLRCGVEGFPRVSLRAGGALVGTPASRVSGSSYEQVPVPSGASVSSSLTVSTSCDSNNSDMVEVAFSGSTKTLSAALVVPACAMTLMPFTAD
jgi:hypothetical protein